MSVSRCSSCVVYKEIVHTEEEKLPYSGKLNSHSLVTHYYSVFTDQ